MQHGSSVERLRDDVTLAFLHMPKVGGRSLNAPLLRRFGTEVCKYSKWGDLVEHRHDLDGYRAFTGHLFAAMTDFLDGDTTTAAFFRNPVDRAVSEYHFVRRTPQHPRHELLSSQTLEEFVSRPNNVTTYSRFLGFAPRDGDYSRMWQDVSDDELLERCVRRIDEMGFVGVTEHFDEHYRAFERWIGAEPAPVIPHRNAAPPDQNAPTAAVQETIRDAAWIDCRLYEHARTVASRQSTVRSNSAVD